MASGLTSECRHDRVEQLGSCGNVHGPRSLFDGKRTHAVNEVEALTYIGHVGCFSGWEETALLCPLCGWSGTGAEAAHEHFAEVMEVLCGRCDHKFGLVRISPSEEETRAAAAAGNPEAQAHLKTLEYLAGARVQIEESKRGRESLPALEGATIGFRFSTEGGNDWMNPTWLVLQADGHEIHRERSGFEHWRAILEISDLVRERYGSQDAWIDPGEAGDSLLGDDLNASAAISAYFNDRHLLPPSDSE